VGVLGRHEGLVFDVLEAVGSHLDGMDDFLRLDFEEMRYGVVEAGEGWGMRGCAFVGRFWGG